MIIKKTIKKYIISEWSDNWIYEELPDRVIVHFPDDYKYIVLPEITLPITIAPDKPMYNSRTFRSITTGGRQLLLSRYLRLDNADAQKKSIDAETYRLYKEVKKLEKILESTPTFGCEFYIEREAVESLNPNHNFEEKIGLSNILLELGGNKGIRQCVNIGDTVELRINPSYAPIIISLSKELFGLGVLPQDVLIGYSVNMVGKDVLENGVPLILVNYFTGLTPIMPSSDGELAFRDVHVYHGATVNPRTGVLETGTPQLNIFSGVTSRIESNEQLKPYNETLENDVQDRLSRMLLPFLVNPEYRSMWKQAIYEIFGLTPKNVDMLEKKLRDAENEDRVWKTSQDLRVFESQRIRDKIKEQYIKLEDRVLLENPQVYLAISSAKL